MRGEGETEMRMMLKVTIPVKAGNAAIKDGSLPKIMSETIERLKPEAAYFLTEDGERTAIMVIDLADPADIPSIAEPFFQGLNAGVTFAPVMNAEDLKRALSKIS
jgi:hypothetical protein